MAELPITAAQIDIAHDLALMADPEQVAKKYGITTDEINVMLRRPEFNKILDEFVGIMLDEAKLYITARAKDAAKVVADIMVSEDASEKGRLTAARDILDRAGLVAKKQTDLNIKNTYNYVTSLSDAELDELIKQMEAANNGGQH